MHFTEDFVPLFETLRSLSLHTPSPLIQAVLGAGSPRLIATEYDRWNGGTRYYSLAIQVPIPLYGKLEGNLEPIEQAILDRVKKIQRSETNDFVTEVIIEPSPVAGDLPVASSIDSQFWLPAHIRLFISHLSEVQESANHLKSSLLRYGITAFVAHQDIKPSEIWLGEIEKALFSMDSLVAILSPGFETSLWTDQEVGTAVGRGVLVVPVRYGIEPYGLVGKHQGIAGQGKTVGEVATALFETLLHNQRTGSRLLSCLVEQFLMSGSPEDALKKISLMEAASEIPRDHLEKICENLGSNQKLLTEVVAERVNQLLEKHGVSPLAITTQAADTPDDDVPF